MSRSWECTECRSRGRLALTLAVLLLSSAWLWAIRTGDWVGFALASIIALTQAAVVLGEWLMSRARRPERPR